MSEILHQLISACRLRTVSSSTCWVVLTGMKVLGKYDGMHGLVANPQPNPQCTESNRKLDALYARALPLAERLILEYVAKLDTDEPLDAAYDHTFGEF